MTRTKNVEHRSKRARSAQRDREESSQQRQCDPRFTSTANEDWYQERAERGFIVERTVTPEIDTDFGVKDSFDVLGWRGILDLPFYYYPELVREFYANLEDKNSLDNTFVRSTVRGVTVELRRANLAQVFGLSLDGTAPDMARGFVPPSDWIYEEALHRIGGNFTRFRSTETNVALATTLPPRLRLLQYLFTTNVIPKSSGKNEMRKADVYFLDKMETGPQSAPGGGVPLSMILISHMRTFARHQKGTFLFPYPRILSAVFDTLGIDVSSVSKKMVSASYLVTQSTVKNVLGLILPDRAQEEGEQGTSQGYKEQQQGGEGGSRRHDSSFEEFMRQQMTMVVERLDDLSGRVSRMERRICRSPTPPPP